MRKNSDKISDIFSPKESKYKSFYSKLLLPQQNLCIYFCTEFFLAHIMFLLIFICNFHMYCNALTSIANSTVKVILNFIVNIFLRTVFFTNFHGQILRGSFRNPRKNSDQKNFDTKRLLHGKVILLDRSNLKAMISNKLRNNIINEPG